jgi:hypothetical protein
MPSSTSRLRFALLGAVFIGLLLPILMRSISRGQEVGLPSAHSTRFWVVAGGGAPSYNEIALEKNVLYFQRSLATMEFDPTAASIFFANGNDGQATVRYLDWLGREQFKVPEIPNLQGASTFNQVQTWLQQASSQQQPIFFYFTGHGSLNEENPNNNAMILWKEDLLSVQQFAGMLDSLPVQTMFVTMMAQCYSGSFANLIYRGGNSAQSIALQTRCGFFATIKTLPSVGCTPEVNEADYRDYSSSFFAGLTGRSRTGETVSSADYDRDGRVSYTEAHAFAKVDLQTTDRPISTLEAWLQEQASAEVIQQILETPIQEWEAIARPDQRYVLRSLSEKFDFNRRKSFSENAAVLSILDVDSEIKQAILERLRMQLMTVGMEQQLRAEDNISAIAILNRLINCENGSW